MDNYKTLDGIHLMRQIMNMGRYWKNKTKSEAVDDCVDVLNMSSKLLQWGCLWWEESLGGALAKSGSTEQLFSCLVGIFDPPCLKMLPYHAGNWWSEGGGRSPNFLNWLR